jgi:hypothetical protein
MINPTGQTLDRLSRQLCGSLPISRSMNAMVVDSDNRAARTSGVTKLRTTRGRYAIRNIILAGLAAVTMVVAAWSMSTFAKPKLRGKVETSGASATIAPFELLERLGRNLPGEYWADPF